MRQTNAENQRRWRQREKAKTQEREAEIARLTAENAELKDALAEQEGRAEHFLEVLERLGGKPNGQRLQKSSGNPKVVRKAQRSSGSG